MSSKIKLSNRPKLLLGCITIILVLGVGLALVFRHHSSQSSCNDKGVIGYCCQVQEHKLAEEGKQPDYVCPG